MAITDEFKNDKAAPAPTKDGPTASEAFKNEGSRIRETMTEDQKAVEGSKSDKVVFLCALGDPNRKQNRVQGKQMHDSYTVVGYKFRVLEDCMVPKAPLKPDWKTYVDVENITEEPVKAGTEIALNIVETGAFISKIEYAGKFTGEGVEVGLTVKHSKDRPEPLPVLKKLSETGSIKENMELIADMVGADGNNKGTPKIKDEYAEKFAVLYRKKKAGGKGVGAGKKASESNQDIAAAFRAFYAKKA